MKSTILIVTLAVLLMQPALKASEKSGIVTLHEPGTPFIAFNIWIKCGSQNDPQGKEGLAAITAELLANSSTTNNTYEQILEKLYPMAAGYDARVDKEMTVFTGRIHKDNLEAFYSLFKDALLAPAFKEEDFKRIKTATMNYLRQTRRFSNDEELSKELLYREIFRGTPYEHPEEGYVSSVDSITLDDVKAFYRKFYTRNNLVAGLGGGYPAGYENKVRTDLDALPSGQVEPAAKSEPAALEGIKVLLVEKNTKASPISFGFPTQLVRSDKDFYAMMVFNSWMGEHRNSFSHLYQVIRETRGMNYGDYTYIEAFPRGFATQVPPVNVSRRSQIFEVWIRPIALTKPGTLHDRTLFAFRAALRELAKVVDNGLSQEAFEDTRNFLKKYTVNYGATISRRLAYRMDDAFYGMPDPGFLASIKPRLDAISLDDVNQTIKKHLQAKNLCVVIITQDAETLKKKILSGAATPITYVGQQPKEVLEEDKAIASFPIPISDQAIKIININEVFER